MKLSALRRAVTKYGGWEDSSRGKGSHTMFFRQRATGIYSYPVPTHSQTVHKRYTKGLRERLGLTQEDGVLDDEFYNS
ncbi:MAG TPA: hypothetical protein VH370_13880 [Humisphaera sp.]|nr:hypothetical protein [Humisphaera sp.]